jgi:hypothetical protein
MVLMLAVAVRTYHNNLPNVSYMLCLSIMHIFSRPSRSSTSSPNEVCTDAMCGKVPITNQCFVRTVCTFPEMFIEADYHVNLLQHAKMA